MSKSKIKLEITDFDMDGFSKAMHWDMKHKLDAVEAIVFDDSGTMSDAEKIAELKLCFEENF